MFFRIVILFFLLSSCRSGEIACPSVKGVRLNKKPSNYLKNIQRNATASAKETRKEQPRIEPRVNKSAKSAADIEEWDCPRPGSKTPLPKAVRENMKKNRKKFDEYYRNRLAVDTVLTKGR